MAALITRDEVYKKALDVAAHATIIKLNGLYNFLVDSKGNAFYITLAVYLSYLFIKLVVWVVRTL